MIAILPQKEHRPKRAVFFFVADFNCVAFPGVLRDRI
jgi:hypothetical protein